MSVTRRKDYLIPANEGIPFDCSDGVLAWKLGIKVSCIEGFYYTKGVMIRGTRCNCPDRCTKEPDPLSDLGSGPIHPVEKEQNQDTWR